MSLLFMTDSYLIVYSVINLHLAKLFRVIVKMINFYVFLIFKIICKYKNYNKIIKKLNLSYLEIILNKVH
jgi:hypothetical protein